MDLARNKAAALASGKSEVEALEEQQRRLQGLREAKRDSLQTGQSTRKSDWNTNGWRTAGVDTCRLYCACNLLCLSRKEVSQTCRGVVSVDACTFSLMR